MDLVSYTLLPLVMPALVHLRRMRPFWLFGLAALIYGAFAALAWVWTLAQEAAPSGTGLDTYYIVPPAYSSAPTLALLMGALFALFAVQTRLRGVFAPRSLTLLFWLLNICALAGSLAPRWIAALAAGDINRDMLLWMNTLSFAAAQAAWLCLIGLLALLALSALQPKPTRT